MDLANQISQIVLYWTLALNYILVDAPMELVKDGIPLAQIIPEQFAPTDLFCVLMVFAVLHLFVINSHSMDVLFSNAQLDNVLLIIPAACVQINQQWPNVTTALAPLLVLHAT
jgi:hypothetical protein